MPRQGKCHREAKTTRHAGTADARPPAARRDSCRAPRRRRRRAAVPAAATMAVTAAATAAAPPRMQRHSWCRGTPEGERPPGVASLDDERGTTAAQVTAGAVRVFDATPPVTRPWPPSDAQGRHVVRCAGGGVGGGTPGRTVAGQ